MDLKHLQLTERASQCKIKAGHTDRVQHVDKTWWWGQTDITYSVISYDVKPVCLNLTLFNVETSTTHKRQSKTTWHGATVSNPCKQEAEGHFHPSVFPLCDCWAFWALLNVYACVLGSLVTIWLYQYWLDVFQCHCPCNHTRVTTHAPNLM